MSRLVWLIATGCAVVVTLSVVPDVHRSADSLSMLLPVVGGVGLVAPALLGGSLGSRVVCVAVSLAALAITANRISTAHPGGELRLYTKNVNVGNTQVDALARDIVQADVDVVMLQEVSDANRRLLAALRDEFPYQHACDHFAAVSLLSRYPFTEPPLCSVRRAFLVVPIEVDGRQVWLGSLHIHWPWPSRSGAAERDTAQMLQSLGDGPVVLAGDLNAVPWSTRATRIAEITGTRPAGPIQTTFRRAGAFPPLPIDYAFAPGGGATFLRPAFGSDHLGLVAEVFLDIVDQAE